MGLMWSGECSRRRKWEPAIDGSGCSSWPTSGANDGKGSAKPGLRRGRLDEAKEHWQTPQLPNGGGETRSGRRDSELLLVGQAQETAELWTTPQAHDERKRSKGRTSGRINTAGNACLATDAETRATPKSCDSDKPSAGKRATSDLSLQVRSIHDGRPLSPTTRTLRLQLNAAFTCWLMGLPSITWTNIEATSFGHAEMQLFLCAQRLLLRSLVGDYETRAPQSQQAT